MVNVISHRRSGTHFLMEILRMSYGKEVRKVHNEESRGKAGEEVYLLRDGRDVMVSCFFWWKESGESKVSGIAPGFKGVSFSYFLRGKVSFKFKLARGGVAPSEVEAGIISDPVGFWVNHTLAYAHLPMVRYEDLVKGEFSELKRIFGERRVRTPGRLVGHSPRKGKAGDWKNYFSKSDLEFFNERVKEAGKGK